MIQVYYSHSRYSQADADKGIAEHGTYVPLPVLPAFETALRNGAGHIWVVDSRFDATIFDYHYDWGFVHPAPDWSGWNDPLLVPFVEGVKAVRAVATYRAKANVR